MLRKAPNAALWMAAHSTMPCIADLRTRDRISDMSKKFNEKEFQEFVVEHLGKISGQVSAVQDDVADFRTDQQSLRKTVVNFVDGQRELLSEIGKLRGEVADIKEELRPIAIAVDKDALMIVQHERRIEVLERHGGSATR
ncbi:hypothetical protein [Reyranella sp.]|uniref:hypothetical protein n=1 Tax=Reyranella sp. TaxID=1929291 RepID=UPI003F716D9E